MQTEIRIEVLSHDHELRVWLLDELALISPTVEACAIESVGGPTASAPALLIVDFDAVTADDVPQLCQLDFPIIGIGVRAARFGAMPFAAVLDATPTSKQFKRAVRDALANRTPAPARRA